MNRKGIFYNAVPTPVKRRRKFREEVMVKKAKLKPFIGQWLIDEMETWNQEYVNMETRGHFTFKKDGTQYFQFRLVQVGSGL